jgi:hypothetical protein
MLLHPRCGSRIPGIALPLLLGAYACVACGGSDAGSSEGALELRREALFDAPVAPECAWSNVVMIDANCTGILVHPEIVLQAGHCPTDARFVVGRSPLEPRPIAIEECRVHPDAGFGRGTDIGFCRLRERAEGFTPILPALGCELEALRPGTPVVAVGYGAASDDGLFGVKRELPGTVIDVGTELTVAGEDFGTCPGDSGGPVVIRLPDGHGLRIAGILSSTDEGAGCEQNRSYYTRLDAVIGWIEQETELDLSPCFDREGTWAPTPQCFAIEDAQACRPQENLAASCGAPFSGGSDAEAPSIALTVGPAPHLVTAEASDRGWGVREVSFEVYGENERLLLRSDGMPPYELDFASIVEDARRIVATVRDLADHTAKAEVRLETASPPAQSPSAGGGCNLSGSRSHSESLIWLLPVAGVLLSRGARRQSTAHKRSAILWSGVRR